MCICKVYELVLFRYERFTRVLCTEDVCDDTKKGQEVYLPSF